MNRKIIMRGICGALLLTMSGVLFAQQNQQRGATDGQGQRENRQAQQQANREARQERIHAVDRDRAMLRDQVRVQDPASEQSRVQERERIYGESLMTDQERNQYRNQLRALNTEREREAFKNRHRAKMQARAQKQGVSLTTENE